MTFIFEEGLNYYPIRPLFPTCKSTLPVDLSIMFIIEPNNPFKEMENMVDNYEFDID